MLSFAIGPIPGQFFNKIFFLSSRPSFTFSTLKQHRWGPLKKPLLNPAAAQLFSYELQCKAAIAPPPIYVDWCTKRERESKNFYFLFWCIDKQYLYKCIEVLFICYFCTLEYYWAWCTGLLIWDNFFFFFSINLEHLSSYLLFSLLDLILGLYFIL